VAGDPSGDVHPQLPLPRSARSFLSSSAAPGRAGASRVAGLLHRGWQAAADAGPPALLLSAEDLGPRVLWANRAITELLGVSSSDLVGHTLADLTGVGCDPADTTGWSTVATEMLTGWGGQREAGVRCIDGSDIRVQLEVAHVSGGDDPDGWLLDIHPLTDAQADQAAALREAEHRFRALAEAAPVGIFLSEAGLRLGYVNDRFVELTGLSRAQLLGTEWLTAIDPDDLPALYTASEAVLGGVARDLNVRLIDDGQSPRWVYVRLAPTVTPARAAGFIGTAEDVTQRRAWEEKITYQAQHDPLTGLVNRRRLVELLHEILDSRRSVDRQFAVLFCDLDGFKKINDTYGHEAGDRVLVEVARRMRRVAREYDIVGRVSGDEFVLVLRNILTPVDAETAAIRQIDALRAPIRIGRNEVFVAASIGLALPSGNDTPESLLRAADQKMYEAKAAGGSGYRLTVGGQGHDEGEPVLTTATGSESEVAR